MDHIAHEVMRLIGHVCHESKHLAFLVRTAGGATNAQAAFYVPLIRIKDSLGPGPSARP
jgi:hypothetical protein